MARAEITYSGAGSYTAFLVDEQNRELERICADSLKKLLALLAERFPGLPVRVVPRRNPAVRIEWTGAGAGRYLAVVVDEHDRVVEEFWGTLPEVEAWMRSEWPELPATFVPMIRNPRSRQQASRKEDHQITDRAYRLRANAAPPPGDRRCSFCGSSRNVEVGHVNGHKEDNAPENKIWTCRPCNVRCGNALRAAGIGRLTHQYNPSAESQGARNLAQWLMAVLSMKGESSQMGVPEAVAMIWATPPEDRSAFASEIWRRRREHWGPTGRYSDVPF